MSSPAPASAAADPGNGRVALTPNVPAAAQRPRARSQVENPAYMAFLQRTIRAAGRRIAAGDVDALPTLVELADELRAAAQDGVDGLRAAGYSWAEIGDRLGITRQTARERFGTGWR